jgi:GH15 family glucan-1,4-alpha-glucosidase
MLSALFELGFDAEAFQFFAFIMDAFAAGPLQIMYGINAERDLTEQTLDHLSGYDGALKVWHEPDRGIWEIRGEPGISWRRRSCAG